MLTDLLRTPEEASTQVATYCRDDPGRALDAGAACWTSGVEDGRSLWSRRTSSAEIDRVGAVMVSPAIVDGLLRTGPGFTGLVLTDDGADDPAGRPGPRGGRADRHRGLRLVLHRPAAR